MRRWQTALLGGFGVVVLTLALVPLAGQAQDTGQPVGEKTSSVDFLLNTAQFDVGASVHGNISLLNYPAGQEHIRIGSFWEGYIVCSSLTPATGIHDLGDSESGFGGFTVLDGGAFPITIRRFSAPHNVDIKIQPSASKRTILVTMTVYNNTGIAATNVRVVRAYDADMNNTTGDFWDRSVDAVWARDSNSLSMVAANFTTPHATAVAGFETTCDVPSVAVPTAFSDRVGRIQYNLGNINPGAKKVVKFLYNAG